MSLQVSRWSRPLRLRRTAFGRSLLGGGATLLVSLVILFVFGVQRQDGRLALAALAAMAVGTLLLLPGAAPTWRVFAVAQAFAVGVAFTLWAALRAFVAGTALGLDLVDGGRGVVILLALAVLLTTAVAIFRGSRYRLLALPELLVIPPLLMIPSLAAHDVAVGGAPDFYNGLAALALLCAGLAALAAFRVLTAPAPERDLGTRARRVTAYRAAERSVRRRRIGPNPSDPNRSKRQKGGPA